MYLQSELWYEPAKKLYKSQDFICEMNSHDHGFLCGMIKKCKPHKVLEIGVAEGGTTAVIMQSLAMLGLDSEVWSVDLSEKFYCDNSKNTGYEYIRLEQEFGEQWGRHYFLFGKTIAGQIDKIGNNIDMVVLDTTHKMPGEVLDFLSIFPYLAPNATVVLHDINLNYSRAVLGNYEQIVSSKDSIATKVLFLTVVAEKYMVLKQGEFPNIAAFSVNKDTGRYIEDLFYSLTHTWAYMLNDEMLCEYRTLFERYYEHSSIKMFERAIINNTRILERYDLREKIGYNSIPKIAYMFPYNLIPEKSKIVIWGAGKVGTEIYSVQSQRKNYQIVAWVDKNYKECNQMGMNVKAPNELENCEYDYIVVAVESERIFGEIQDEIIKNNWNKGNKVIGPIEKY